MDWIKAVSDIVHSNESHTLIRHDYSKLVGVRVLEDRIKRWFMAHRRSRNRHLYFSTTFPWTR